MKLKKIIFILSVSIFSLSAVASNNESQNHWAFNGQSVTEARREVEYITVVGMEYNKYRKEFVPFAVNKYVGKIHLKIVRGSDGNMYYEDGNGYIHKIERNRYKTYDGTNVSGYSYMCDTAHELIFFNL